MGKTLHIISRFCLGCIIILLPVVFESSGNGIQTAFAQEGDPEDESAIFSIRNPNFEDSENSYAPWVITSNPVAGEFDVEDCCANALPLTGLEGGNDLALYPNQRDLTLRQAVQVIGGKKYILSAWVAASGTTAEMAWWNNGDTTRRVCATITNQWPDYRPITCEFTVPANATKIRVILKAFHTNSTNWVVTDGWVLTQRGHFYAQAQKTGIFYGVRADINTINPSAKIREPIFYYATINITNARKGIETGWQRGINTTCQNQFSYSSSVFNWSNQPVHNPMPASNTSYQFWLYKLQGTTWRVDITNLVGGQLLFRQDIFIDGLEHGTRLLAGGEVFSPHRINDMGINGFLNLKWRDQNGAWHAWDGHNGEVRDTPYAVAYHPTDPLNNIQASGNNILPLAPGSPCP